MSFEGYYQLLCSNGHYTTDVPYMSYSDKCSTCGAGIVDSNLVKISIVDVGKGRKPRMDLGKWLSPTYCNKIYNYYDDRGKLHFFTRWFFPYAHYCEEMDGLLILDNIVDCFCEFKPYE